MELLSSRLCCLAFILHFPFLINKQKTNTYFRYILNVLCRPSVIYPLEKLFWKHQSVGRDQILPFTHSLFLFSSLHPTGYYGQKRGHHKVPGLHLCWLRLLMEQDVKCCPCPAMTNKATNFSKSVLVPIIAFIWPV